jgi:hypothetical protein
MAVESTQFPFRTDTVGLSWVRDRVRYVHVYLTNTANTRVFNVALPGARMKPVGRDSEPPRPTAVRRLRHPCPVRVAIVDVRHACPMHRMW